MRAIYKGAVAGDKNNGGTDFEHDGRKACGEDPVAETVRPVRVVGAVAVSHIGKKLNTVIHLHFT